MIDVSPLLDDLKAALTVEEKAKSALDAKRSVLAKAQADLQAAVDKAAADLSGVTADHQKAVDAANAIRDQVNKGLTEKLGSTDTGRVR